jgi:hypothetical protein
MFSCDAECSDMMVAKEENLCDVRKAVVIKRLIVLVSTCGDNVGRCDFWYNQQTLGDGVH